MALIARTNYTNGVIPAVTADRAGDVVSQEVTITLSANPTANDTYAFLTLPANHVPVDCILTSDDLDTNGTPPITMSVGVLNAALTAIDTTSSSGGAAWISASTIGQSAGLARPTTVAISRVTPTSADRIIGVAFPAISATFASGKISLTLIYRQPLQGQ